jgi:hypothetical protein
MDWVREFAEWAWARHHNPFSWYIRPLFLIPFAIFAYRRSWPGVIATMVALATSMFWFPAPAAVDPEIERFLAMEQEYLRSPWSPWKGLLTAIVPLFFLVLGAALWRRSLPLGLVIINLAAVAKIAWSFAYGGRSGWAIVPPAVIGMVLTTGALLWWHRRRSSALP